jgi:hypothetical protein
MSNKIKIIIAVFFTVTVFAFLFFIFVPVSGNQPFNYLSLHLILDQPEKNVLHVGKIMLEEGYPQDFKINHTRNYYLISQIDGKNRELFRGKILNSYQLMPYIIRSNNSQLDKNNFEPQPEILVDTLDLFLPYFREAKQIEIFSEDGNRILLINLSDYGLRLPKRTVNLCGNGICDYDEKLLTCYKDCRITVSGFFSRLSQWTEWFK